MPLTVPQSTSSGFSQTFRSAVVMTRWYPSSPRRSQTRPLGPLCSAGLDECVMAGGRCYRLRTAFLRDETECQLGVLFEEVNMLPCRAPGVVAAIIGLAGAAAIAQTSTPPAPQMISANGTELCMPRRARARRCTVHARRAIPAPGSRNGRRWRGRTDSSRTASGTRGRCLA